MLEQALAAERRRRGDLHANTLISMAQFALLLHEAGELGESETLWRECLKGRMTTLGPDSSTTLRTMTSLAQVLYARGKTAEAAALQAQALEAQQRLLGPDHPDTLDSRKLLAQFTNTPPDGNKPR